MFRSSRVAILVLASSLVGVLPAQVGNPIHVTDEHGVVAPGKCYGPRARVQLEARSFVSAAGAPAVLADGKYFFQVTDPSGTVLLSTDAIRDREVVVLGGEIALSTGTHPWRTGPNGGMIGLHPFATTPAASEEYRVWLTPASRYDVGGAGFHGFDPRHSVTDGFVIQDSGTSGPTSLIAGRVFYDFDLDGVRNPSIPEEIYLAGWRVELRVNGVLDGVLFTDAIGGYIFQRPLDGTAYEIRQVAPAPGFIPVPLGTWLPTNGESMSVVAGAPVIDGFDFGNVQYEVTPGVGFSAGYWYTQGASTLDECDPDWRTALNGLPGSPVCLRYPVSTLDPAVSIFTVPPLPVPFEDALEQLGNFFVGQMPNDHAAYLLSVQVAAAILNNTCGDMQGPVYIDRFGDGVLVSLEEMLEGATTLLCDPNAGLTGPNDPTSPSPFDPMQTLRDAMIACTNEFSQINGTSNLSEPQVVYQRKESHDPFSSPYGLTTGE